MTSLGVSGLPFRSAIGRLADHFPLLLLVTFVLSGNTYSFGALWPSAVFGSKNTTLGQGTCPSAFTSRKIIVSRVDKPVKTC